MIMTRLRYIRTADMVFDIDLHNGYWIKAMAKFDDKSGKCNVAFYIKENTINQLMLIETLDNVSFDKTYKTIGSAILKYVATLLSENYFDDCIKQYEYEVKCFDRGNELFEVENAEKSR